MVSKTSTKQQNKILKTEHIFSSAVPTRKDVIVMLIGLETRYT